MTYIVERLHPPVASAVVEIPEWNPDHVYAWKPANNYKGWKLIARGEAGVDDASVMRAALEATTSAGYGSLVIAPGKYTCTDGIILDPKILNFDETFTIMAYGAEINYTGTGVFVDILENQSVANNANFKWLGGAIKGNTNATAFRITDSFGHVIAPDLISGFDKGVHLRNVDYWTPFNKILVDHIESCNIGIQTEPASETGGSGSETFAGTYIDCEIGSIPSGGIGLKLHGAVYKSRIRVQIFVSENAVGIDLDGHYQHTIIEGAIENPDPSTPKGTGIRIPAGGLSGQPPLFLNFGFYNLATNIENEGASELPFLVVEGNELRINNGTQIILRIDSAGINVYAKTWMSGNINFNGTYQIEKHKEGTTTSDPKTDDPAGWLEIIDANGNKRYIPYYP